MAPKTATRTGTKAAKTAAASRPRSAPRSTTKAKSKAKAAPKPVAPKFKSRAVLRLIEAGSGAFCERCEEQVKFRARERLQQAICNVYVKGVWNRVEHYHEECYLDAGEPYGPAAPPEPRRSSSPAPASSEAASAA